MTTLLICNIGSQDLAVPREVLPDHLQRAATKGDLQYSERERATWLNEHFEQLKDQLTLPIIDKALEYIGRSTIDTLVLIASDQDDERYRHSDTIITAEVVRNLLLTQDFRMSQLQIWPLRDADQAVQPADLDAVLRFLERRLAVLDAELQPQQVYLEVAGGTPSMTSALLLAGTEVFQARASALYVTRTSAMPQQLAVGRRLLAAPIREVLRSNIATFQYAAAAATWEQFRPYFTDQATESSAQLMTALIDHAAARINLDLHAARLAIQGLDVLAGGQFRSLIEPLYNALVPRSREKDLAEVLHVAQVRFATQVYTDFLSQIVRLVENMLRLMCLRHGVQFINWQHQPDENGARVDQTWASRHGLHKVPIGQSGLQKVLRTIAPNDPQAQAVLDAADRLESIIRLRNESTHSLKGIAAADITAAFADDYTTLLPYMEQIYATIIGASVPPNPYTAINASIEHLLFKRA